MESYRLSLSYRPFVHSSSSSDIPAEAAEAAEAT